MSNRNKFVRILDFILNITQSITSEKEPALETQTQISSKNEKFYMQHFSCLVIATKVELPCSILFCYIFHEMDVSGKIVPDY